jgi:hypothetical protein
LDARHASYGFVDNWFIDCAELGWTCLVVERRYFVHRGFKGA